jgi:hypothetical protein
MNGYTCSRSVLAYPSLVLPSARWCRMKDGMYPPIVIVARVTGSGFAGTPLTRACECFSAAAAIASALSGSVNEPTEPHLPEAVLYLPRQLSVPSFAFRRSTYATFLHQATADSIARRKRDSRRIPVRICQFIWGN